MGNIISTTSIDPESFFEFLDQHGFAIVRKPTTDENAEFLSRDLDDSFVKKQKDRIRRLREQMRLEEEVGNPELVARLKQWRREKAKEENVAPFIILGNIVLLHIVDACPSTPEELLAVKGFGSSKMEKYGAEILNIVAEVMEVVDEP